MKTQTSDDAWWLRLSRPVRQLPADAVGAVGLALVADLLVLLPNTPPILRFSFGALLLFFLPGYAAVAALFPARPPADTRLDADARWSRRRSIRDGTIGLAERVALAVGTSVTVLVLAGLVLAATPWGLALDPLLALLTGLVVLGTLVAIVRRRRLPTERRFRVPVRRWVARARASITGANSRTEMVVTALLAVAIVAAMSSLTYALAVPTDGESYTDFYLVTEDESGELAAGDYPTEYTRGESRTLTVGIENHEDRDMTYTVVVLLQRVEPGGELAVLENRELDRFEASLANGETWTDDREVTPTIVGEDLRLVYLLYQGDPPERPSRANADESLYLWVDVSNPES
jgi:uncharacterized membrane protein